MERVKQWDYHEGRRSMSSVMQEPRIARTESAALVLRDCLIQSNE
jgi:hypothetical protein